MNPITWVQGLQGVAVVAVICGLLFVEEVGVPLPFAQCDLVLASAGIAIAGGRVNPVLLVPAVMLNHLFVSYVGAPVFNRDTELANTDKKLATR